MKNLLLLFICGLTFYSCNNNKVINECEHFKNYNLLISTYYYNYNLNSGEFRIQGYKFVDTIILSKAEKNRIAKLFFQLNIDTLNGEKIPSELLIMPDAHDEIVVKLNDHEKAKLLVPNKYQFSKSDKAEQNVFKFDKKLFEILNKNARFKKCMDTLQVAIKEFPPLL